MTIYDLGNCPVCCECCLNAEVYFLYINRPGYGGVYGLEYVVFRLKKEDDYITEWRIVSAIINNGIFYFSGSFEILFFANPPNSTSASYSNVKMILYNKEFNYCGNSKNFNQDEAINGTLTLTLMSASDASSLNIGDINHVYISNTLEVELCQ